MCKGIYITFYILGVMFTELTENARKQCLTCPECNTPLLHVDNVFSDRQLEMRNCIHATRPDLCITTKEVEEDGQIHIRPDKCTECGNSFGEIYGAEYFFRQVGVYYCTGCHKIYQTERYKDLP